MKFWVLNKKCSFARRGVSEVLGHQQEDGHL